MNYNIILIKICSQDSDNSHSRPWWLSVLLVIRRLRVRPPPDRQHSLRFDHEIFSTVILSLPLIQEGQLSVSVERLCTILVNCLED